MSELLRKVNDPLRLKLKLEPKDDTYFVRAELTDQDDTTLAGSPIALTNQGGGIYADDNSNLMPNVPEVRANFFVYYDAAFTREACEHGGFATFKRDDLDLSTFFPKGAKVIGTVRTINKVVERLAEPTRLKVAVANDSKVAAVVNSNKIKITVNTQNQIKGVVSE